MAKHKFFGKDIEPRCDYCEYGRVSATGDIILCEKKGVVDLHYSCKKFDYDPLKRVPKRRLSLPEYSSEDFSL